MIDKNKDSEKEKAIRKDLNLDKDTIITPCIPFQRKIEKEDGTIEITMYDQSISL